LWNLKLEVRPFEARGPRDLEGAFAAMAKAQMRGLVVHEDTTLLANAKLVADLATRQRLPVSGFPELAAVGREARPVARRADDYVQADHQRQNGQSARPRHPGITPASRR
jgi:hypothetical protein